MTEKKKRGRPVGSGKKKLPIASFNPSKLDEEFDEVFKDKGFAITPNKKILAIDGDKFKPQPDNWFTMSRTEQMRWLQENRK